MNIIKKVKKGLCGFAFASLLVSTNVGVVTVHADTTVQQNVVGEETPTQGNSKIDVDGRVKQEGEKNSQKTDPSKPSTTITGNGLNDKLAKNAKTGEITSSGMWIIFIAGSGVLVLLVAKKRKSAFSKM